jgi:hypothetical protein
LFNNGYGNLASIRVSQRDNGALADDGQLEFQVASNASLDTKLTILNTGVATFSNTVISSDGFQGRYYRINEASVNRGGLYPYNLVFGSGTDYSIGLFSEGEIFLASGGSATKRLVMNNSGNVGIGTTSPNTALHVVGGITVNSTTPFSFIGNGNAGTYTQTAIYSNQNNTSNNTANGIFIERGRLSDSPSAEIRSFVVGDRGGAIQLLLDKDGKLTVTNDVVAYGSPSDISLKTNIKPLENSLDKIIKLQGVSFTWKENTSENNLIGIKDDIGFIAQQVQEILPDLVRKNDNGLLSLRDKGITALLVEAIKELKTEVEDLKYLLSQK